MTLDAPGLLGPPQPARHDVEDEPLLPPEVLANEGLEAPGRGAQGPRHGPLHRLRPEHLVAGDGEREHKEERGVRTKRIRRLILGVLRGLRDRDG